MSSEGEKGEGGQQPGMKVGQDLPRKAIVLMLAVGAALVVWLIVASSELRVWPWSSSELRVWPGIEDMATKAKLIALIVASMTLANHLLKSDDLDSFDREFSTIVIASFAFWGAFFLLPPRSRGEGMFTLFAMLPLVIALAGPLWSQLKRFVWEISFFVVGILMYIVAVIMVSDIFGLASKMAASVGCMCAEIIIGSIGLIGVAFTIGATIVGIVRIVWEIQQRP